MYSSTNPPSWNNPLPIPPHHLPPFQLSTSLVRWGHAGSSCETESCEELRKKPLDTFAPSAPKLVGVFLRSASSLWIEWNEADIFEAENVSYIVEMADNSDTNSVTAIANPNKVLIRWGKETLHRMTQETYSYAHSKTMLDTANDFDEIDDSEQSIRSLSIDSTDGIGQYFTIVYQGRGFPPNEHPNHPSHGWGGKGGNMPWIRINDLIDNRRYLLRIKAVTEGGNGPYSEVVRVKTRIKTSKLVLLIAIGTIGIMVTTSVLAMRRKVKYTGQFELQ